MLTCSEHTGCLCMSMRAATTSSYSSGPQTCLTPYVSMRDKSCNRAPSERWSQGAEQGNKMTLMAHCFFFFHGAALASQDEIY